MANFLHNIILGGVVYLAAAVALVSLAVILGLPVVLFAGLV